MNRAAGKVALAAGLVLAGLLFCGEARAEEEEEEEKKIDFYDDFASGSLAAGKWSNVEDFEVEDFDVADFRLVRTEGCDSVLSVADVKDSNIGNAKTSRNLRFTAGGVDLGNPDSPYLRSITLRVERKDDAGISEFIYATLQAYHDENGDFKARYLLRNPGGVVKEPKVVDAALPDLVLTIIGDKAELAYAAGELPITLPLSDAQKNPVYMCRVEMQADLRLVESPSVDSVEAKSEWSE